MDSQDNRHSEVENIPVEAVRHRWFDNLFGLICGTYLPSLGLFFLHSSGAVTGGTAGLSLLFSYLFDLPVSIMFLLVNVPFFLIAIGKKGWKFTFITLVSVTAVSAMTEIHPLLGDLVDINPVYGTLTGNLLCGLGVLILFRHGSSLGGINILVLVLQERLGLNAGLVQMGIDLAIVASAFFVSSWQMVLVSGAGAVILNLVLALNHKPGRYTGF